MPPSTVDCFSKFVKLVAAVPENSAIVRLAATAEVLAFVQLSLQLAALVLVQRCLRAAAALLVVVDRAVVVAVVAAVPAVVGVTEDCLFLNLDFVAAGQQEVADTLVATDPLTLVEALTYSPLTFALEVEPSAAARQLRGSLYRIRHEAPAALQLLPEPVSLKNALILKTLA